MSERTARLDHLLRQEISTIIGKEIADPRIGFVTVTSVEVAPDLGHATVWVSAIGSPQERRASLRALGRAMPFVRHRLGELRLKRIPQLHVREDDTAVRGTRVLRLIDELAAGAGAGEAGERAREAGPDALPTPGPSRSLAEPPIPTPPGATTRPRRARGARPSHGSPPGGRPKGSPRGR